jgi:hypothetical protein
VVFEDVIASCELVNCSSIQVSETNTKVTHAGVFAWHICRQLFPEACSNAGGVQRCAVQ